MPCLPEGRTDNLERDLTVKEFLTAVNSLKMGKASGLDGYTPYYSKKFAEVLAPHFVNSLRDPVNIPKDTLMAHILVIPKEGKDPPVSELSTYISFESGP